MKYHLLAMLALLLSLTGLAADEKQTDKDKLQGTWIVTSMEFDGIKADIPADLAGSFTFKDDTLTIKDPKKKDDVKGTFKSDNKQDLDFTVVKGSNPKLTETRRMLYKLDGGTLTLVGLARDNTVRPKAFDDKGVIIMILKKK